MSLLPAFQPVLAPVAVSQAAGTVFGTMTQNAGLANAFDSNTNQARTSCATLENVTQSLGIRYAGKDWGAGSEKTMYSVKCYGANNESGFTSSAVSVTLTLRGSNDGVSFTDLGSASTTGSAGQTTTITATTISPFRYHVVDNYQPGQVVGTRSTFAELEFTELA